MYLLNIREKQALLFGERGHVVLVLEGELITELKDGREFKVDSGISFQIADDDDNPHRSYTEKGAIVFIVD